jgi:probable phosphoglycerate mutase
MKLYLIRHGETDWNIVKRLQGATDIPLNENGEALARETAEGLKDIPFDMVFTSPLRRAYRTAEIVKGNREIPLIIEERIREICFGDYEGLVSKSEGYSIPDPDFKFFFTKTDCYKTPPNGEPMESLLERTNEFLEELKKREDLKDKTILVSTHGAAVRALLSNIEHCDIAHFWGKGVHKNCGVSCVELVDDEYQILWENKIFYVKSE